MSQPNSRQSIGLKLLFFGLSVGGAPLALLMALAPESSLTKRLVASDVLIQGYSGVYTLLFVHAMIREPQMFVAAAKLDVDSLVALTGKRKFATSVWAHASTCDLFIARWIYLDSLNRGRVARWPILLQFILGPIGLFTYLTVNRSHERTSGD